MVTEQTQLLSGERIELLTLTRALALTLTLTLTCEP